MKLAGGLSTWALLALLLALATPAWLQAATVKESRGAMGSRFELTAVHEDPAVAREAVELAFLEIERIEARISSWRESSETSAVNRAAGRGAVVVSGELFALVERSLKVSRLTGGAFDITFAGAGRLWNFKDPIPELPNPRELHRALARVDYQKVILDPEALSIELLEEGMRIGFGAIGKGYAANRAAAEMRALGLPGGLVNAGGDLVAFGRREDGEAWTVGIADPLQPSRTFAHLELSEQAIVTSGDYERYVEIDGVRYAHILDPRTGWPVRGVASVTVLCPDAELADALATSVFVMGVEEGLRLVDQLRGVEALVVDRKGKIHGSESLRTQLREGAVEPMETSE